MAQRMGHGGGGGNRGGGFRPVPNVGRTINGGSRNNENHVFRAPERRENGPRGGFQNEGIYHHTYGSHAYYGHPYHPYYWGPRWHPFGFFVGALAADAFMFSIANQPYYYDDGVYYQPSGSGYSVVPPPIGAVVNYLPEGFVTVQVENAIYYYYGGAFYLSQGNSYRVIPAPIGAIITEIPEGATEQNINGQSYLFYNNTYYEPISLNGQDAYEVVTVN